MRHIVLIIIIASFSLNGNAQNLFRYLDQLSSNKGYFTVKPVLGNQKVFYFTCGVGDPAYDHPEEVDLEALYREIHDTTKIPKRKVVLDWCKDHFFETNFISIEKNDCCIKINPLFIFEGRKMKGNDTLSLFIRNTRGIEAFGKLGGHIGYYTSFYENQGGFFPYEKEYIDKYDVIPGQGHGKEFKETQLDWAWVTGHINVRASRNLEFVLGYGKNFIGHGYRSIILSDQAFNYPYVRSQVSLFDRKLFFNSIWAQTQSWNHDSDFVSNNHTFHNAIYNVLGWNPQVLKGINLSLIHGITWKKSQKSNFLAADLRVSPFRELNIYAQTRYDKDNNPDKKFGYQAGFEIFDVFELFRINSLLRALKYVGLINSYRNPLRWHIQAEYNSNSLTAIDPLQKPYSFAHYAEPLQFSLDKETLFISDLTIYNRFELSLMHSDSDIRKYTDIKLSLIANRTTGWRIYGGGYKRNSDTYYYIGTSICPERRYEREM